MKRLGLVVFILPLCLFGCLNAWHGDYSCKGYPEGVRCKSVREVYDLTNYRDALSGKEGDETKPSAMLASGPGEGGPVQGMGYIGPLPLRTPAQIIRIWVAPWESQDGMLHLPNYIYSEVQSRQWSIGEAKMQVAPQITPLESVGSPERETQSRGKSKDRSARQSTRRPASRNKTQNNTLFPEQIQRPKVDNKSELEKLQQLPSRIPAGESNSFTTGGNIAD